MNQIMIFNKYFLFVNIINRNTENSLQCSFYELQLFGFQYRKEKKKDFPL